MAPLRRDWIASPNHSDRYGGAVRLIIIHTAEGALTYQSLGSYFSSPSAEVSSHVGVDDSPGVVGEYVAPGRAAWTAGDANGYAVQAELCAFAGWDAAEWARHPVILENCARWVAEEAERFGIPLVRSSDRGVCGHVDVSGQGGHWDPGPAFPMDHVIQMAQTIAGGGSPSAPAAEEERDDSMVATDEVTGGQWVAYPDGAVHTVGDAPFLGAANDPGLGAEDRRCIGIAPYEDGYVLVMEFGSGEPGDRDPRAYHFRR